MMGRNHTGSHATWGGVDIFIHTIKRGVRTGMLAVLALSVGIACVATISRVAMAQDAPAKTPLQHQSGSIKSIDGSTLVITPDSGNDVTVTMPATRACSEWNRAPRI